MSTTHKEEIADHCYTNSSHTTAAPILSGRIIVNTYDSKITELLLENVEHMHQMAMDCFHGSPLNCLSELKFI